MMRRYAAFIVVSLLAIPTVGAESSGLSYTSFKKTIALDLDVNRIAVFDESVGAQHLRELLRRRSIDFTRVATSQSGWTTVDLSGGPAAGNPLMVIDEIAQDPVSTLFASPIFVAPDGSNVTMLTGRTVNLRFVEGVPLSVVRMELDSVGLGEILEEDWQGRPNLFRVAAGTRSGIDLLNAANALAQLVDVIFAVPSFRLTGSDLLGDDPELLDPTPATLARLANPTPMTPLDRRGTLPTLASPASKDAAVCPVLINPDDPLLVDSWGLDQANDIDVDGPRAWLQCSGAGTPVVVFDDGVAVHPDLPAVTLGGDFTDICDGFPCAGEAPADGCSKHGTAVAGALAALGNNTLGSAGIAPSISVISIRIGTYDTTVLPGRCVASIKTEWLATGIGRAVQLGARVTSLSWNWPRSWEMPDVIDAYRAAYESGVVHFNSVGNFNEDRVRSPGNIPEVNAVSGLDSLGNRFDLTEVSPAFASNFGPAVAFSGPGQDILTTDLVGAAGSSDGSPKNPFGPDFDLRTGSSFACPFVAGTAALILSCRPDLPPRAVEFLMRRTALDLGDPGKDVVHGHGLVRAGEAVEVAPAFIFQDDFESGSTAFWSPSSP